LALEWESEEVGLALRLASLSVSVSPWALGWESAEAESALRLASV
jgi:hypothetical protein